MFNTDVKPVTPNVSQNAQGNIDLDTILQKWVAAILTDNLDSSLIRPMWQPVDTPYPDVGIDWCACAVRSIEPDINTYNILREDNVYEVHRHEFIEFATVFYGERSMELCGILRDGCVLWQNRAIIEINGIYLTKIGDTRRLPQLINQQWNNRVDFTLHLKRHVIHVYNVNSILTNQGIVQTNKQQNFEVHQ